MGPDGASWTGGISTTCCASRPLAPRGRPAEALPGDRRRIRGAGRDRDEQGPGCLLRELDLPPLTTVASFYLRTLFGDRVTISDGTIAEVGPIELPGSACLPNWRIGDVAGPFDVFVNSYSFQEMEPDVVEEYVRQVAAKGVTYVVSLNSILGKRRATRGRVGGVIDPVTSDRIVAMLEGGGSSSWSDTGTR